MVFCGGFELVLCFGRYCYVGGIILGFLVLYRCIGWWATRLVLLLLLNFFFPFLSMDFCCVSCIVLGFWVFWG